MRRAGPLPVPGHVLYAMLGQLARCCVILAALGIGALPARAAAAPDAPELILEVRLDQHQLSAGVIAYQQDGDILLPLGEMARLLTIAIRSEPQAGRASGFILDQQNGFELDLARGQVAYNGQRHAFDARRVRQQADDLYVPARLLASWLPLGFELDLPTLSLTVRPRVVLPVQARLARAGSTHGTSGTGTPSKRVAYPLQALPYAAAGMPFIDQTMVASLRREGRRSSASIDYMADLAGELAGMEAAIHVSSASGRGEHPGASTGARVTLGRHDPDGALLGLLRARSLELGSVAAPGIDGVALSISGSHGVALSNRPLGWPTRSDYHTLEGMLAPGWEVELYFNGALVGYQQARADGKYRFEDQPLLYGENEFRLVFHGPLGQLRVERHQFSLDQTLPGQGEVQYSVVSARDYQGQRRASAQVDIGLGQPGSSLAGALKLGLVRLALDGKEQRYANAALHAYWQGLLVDAGVVRMDGGGALAQAGVRTRIGSVAIGASRAHAHDFVSEMFRPATDPVKRRDEVRLDAAADGVAVSLQARRDRRRSGAADFDASARMSTYQGGTALSHSLNWSARGGRRQAGGALRVSRRLADKGLADLGLADTGLAGTGLAGVGLVAQLLYQIKPGAGVTEVALGADRSLGHGYQLNVDLARSVRDSRYRLALGLSKRLGSFGMGLQAQVSSRGQYSVGLTLFAGAAREPRHGDWIVQAQALAPSGAASARVFLDKNLNGIMDGEDQPLAGAGLIVNGSHLPGRTDAAGTSWLGALPAQQAADIGLDTSTLEDPQWQARTAGIRIVPRAGTVARLEFAVTVTGEIDGTTYLRAEGGPRAVGQLTVELVDGAGAVVGSTVSGADGYYVLGAVLPGQYRLRVAPGQLARLKLVADREHAVTLASDGGVVSGRDFLVGP